MTVSAYGRAFRAMSIWLREWRCSMNPIATVQNSVGVE